MRRSGPVEEKPMRVPPDQKPREGGLAESVRVVVHALIIAVVVRTLLFQPFNIPSGSMEGTLLVGDYLFVSTFSYGYTHYALPLSPRLFSGRIFGSEPRRGDVVVFRLPSDDSVDYIKRVIGLPGDRIQMIDGVPYLNGVAVKREPAADFIDDDEAANPVHVKRWRETLPNGVSYDTLDRVENSDYDNTGIYLVPPGQFFMMGDNRDNSADSRIPPQNGGVGYVPLENIVGRAQLIFFSIRRDAHAWEVWRWPWSVRWSRLISMVR
jgi:signal peptidase I